MENRMTALYHSLCRHFTELCTIPVTVVDTDDREILFTHCENTVFFCDQCPNRCRLLSTMLYGCNEARRWNGRYVFYCPIGLVFSAVSVPETDQTVLAGPMIMGEVEDALYDLPEHIDPDGIRTLFHCSANTLNHISSILEMAVYGLRYLPKPSTYDRNILSGEEETPEEQAEIYTSFPFFSSLEEDFQTSVRTGNKSNSQPAAELCLQSPSESAGPD